MVSDADLFRADLVFFDLDPADPRELFEMLAPQLSGRGLIADGWLAAIVERERRYPTGLMTASVGCAIPHTDPALVKEPYIAVVRPRSPVVFQPMAAIGEPVPARIVVNLGVVRDGGQVRVLQALMSTFMDKALVGRIMAQETPEALLRALTEKFDRAPATSAGTPVRAGSGASASS